ncbi:hypothetical protein BGZ63DRAFT_150225 [Mariannaea sp. PMI_226]|nr:hypothetical protein BGZ63DRAFT_150225 [Mariannaea sp. PMI_226]
MASTSKLVFEPEELSPGFPAPFADLDGSRWKPMNRHACSFAPHHFETIMMNLIKNPNLNSKWLFRADIIYDDKQSDSDSPSKDQDHRPLTRSIHGFTCSRTVVRRLIPRNTLRDAPLNQTCSFHTSSSGDDEGEKTIKTLVIYEPHVKSIQDIPFYHPKVKSIAQLHEWDSATSTGTVSIHFLPFQDDEVDQVKLERIAYHLLQIIHKHGHTTAVGYTKRVHHDIIVPQSRFQDRYSELKNKYARALVETWAETTDPSKHVFEDLGIASFLIELWADMYQGESFPGFIDIGCGNGLLVHILQREGYSGWGFDARERKSWAQYMGASPSSPSGRSLEQRLLLPSVVTPGDHVEEEAGITSSNIHDGIFPKGTFIISNHADELTPWTPILATISECPFIMIPCCSHNLTGERYRAPPPKDKTKSHSTFASLVDWVTHIAEDCGWAVETEMLRIPSTRNTGLLGRRRSRNPDEVNIPAVLNKYGGIAGYNDNVAKLLKAAPSNH